MPFFPDVTQGDRFMPSASLDNSVRRMVNALNGFQSGAIVGQASRAITIPVYNNTASTIIAGTAVCFTADGDICENIIPAEPIADVTKPWGVLISTLTPQAIGDCVISGPVTVTVTGIGDHAQPNPSSPAVFDCISGGVPILFTSNNQALINLGATNSPSGTFGVTAVEGLLNIAEGWLNRNGEWLTIPKVTGVTPETGWLCICSTIENGNWTYPQIKIATPAADAYPIAEIKVEDNSITIRQLPVVVATINLAKPCPMAEF